MALPTTAEQYKLYQDAQNKYQQQQTGGTSFLAALKAALAGADTQNTALRDQQKALTAQQFTEPTKYREELIGQGITDPYKRQALLDARLGNVASNLTGVQGKLSDLGGQRADVLNTAGKAYDAETQAALNQANSAGDFFKTLLGQDQSKENMLAQQQFTTGQSKADQVFQAQQNQLNRENQIRQAQIAHSGNRDSLSLLQTLGLQKDNPLGLAQIKGYSRETAPNGGKGFWFYKNNPDGTRTAVSVDEVANAIGGDRNALLAGSSNPEDQAKIDRASGKPPTMSQETTALYADRIKQSNAVFDTLNKYTSNMNPVSYLANTKSPQFFNFLKSKDFQSLDQAERNFINAVLRRESGAVINPEEFVNARLQYFPQPGDKPETIKQKKANRDLVQKRFIQSSGNAYQDEGVDQSTNTSDPLGIR